MLPTFENLDDLTLDFEEENRSKTKTFGVKFGVEAFEPTSVAKLGVGKLGKLKIGQAVIYNPMRGMLDEVDALKQSIMFMLSTEADQYIIYPYTYGINSLDLIGKPIYYVMAVLPNRIKNTLLLDDRVLDVTDFEFTHNKNKLQVTFVVHSIYGEVTAETEVAYNV